MPTDKPSAEWTKKEVLKNLRESVGSGETVRAQVFLMDHMDGDLQKTVKDLVETAKDQVGKSGATAEVGKIHKLAKSFSIEAAPDLLAALADQPGVKTVLPSEIADIYPKPVKEA
jgi:hypothetical protein